MQTGVGRLHLCFLRCGNGNQDDGLWGFWLQMLPGRQVEPARLCDRNGRVGLLFFLDSSFFLSQKILNVFGYN